MGLYTIHPKISRFDPLLAESSILYAERIAWPPPRNSTSLWQYRRIFDSSWQYKQGSLSRGHIYGLSLYTQKSVVSTPLLAESSILYAERIAWPAPQFYQFVAISKEYLIVRGNISRGVFLEAIYIGLYTIHPKISRFDPASCRKFYIIC